jgi:hypothetical protein
MRTACTLPPDSLRLMMIENNPDAVRQNLAALKVATTGKETSSELLEIVNGLQTENIEKNVEILATIFSFPLNKEAENANLMFALAQDSIGAMVVCNTLVQTSDEHKFVPKRELKTLQIWTTVGVVLAGLVLLGFVATFTSNRN